MCWRSSGEFVCGYKISLRVENRKTSEQLGVDCFFGLSAVNYLTFLSEELCKYNSFPKWSSFHSFGQHLPLVFHGLSRLLMFTPFLSTFLPHLPIFTLIYPHSTPFNHVYSKLSTFQPFT